eukprot:6466735-Alexandrium_andersonii.AAC.1
MSASLVGSEMCIRDSSCAARPTSIQPGFAHARARCQTAAPAPPRPSWAVSYTHLTLPTICSV